MDLDIERRDFFHAHIVKEDVAKELKSYGDYLLRVDYQPDHLPSYIFCINVGKETAEVKEYPINYNFEKSKYSLSNGGCYKTIGALVDDLISKKKLLPEGCQAELLRPVERPKWQIAGELLTLKKDDILGTSKLYKVCSGELTWYGKKTRIVAKTDADFEGKTENWKSWWSDYLRDACSLRNVSHPNCLKIYGVVAEEKMLIMEHMNGGTLAAYLKKDRESALSLEEKVGLGIQAAFGLEYLHAKNLMHRKLTAQNCLFNKADGAEKFQLKIDDCFVSREECHPLEFPIRNMAPESVRDGFFTSMSDVWMFGSLLFEILTNGKELYEGMPRQQIQQMISAGLVHEMPADMPAALADLVRSCWDMDPLNRPAMNKVIKTLESLCQERAPMQLDPRRIKRTKKEEARKKKMEKSEEEDERKPPARSAENVEEKEKEARKQEIQREKDVKQEAARKKESKKQDEDDKLVSGVEEVKVPKRESKSADKPPAAPKPKEAQEKTPQSKKKEETSANKPKKDEASQRSAKKKKEADGSARGAKADKSNRSGRGTKGKAKDEKSQRSARGGAKKPKAGKQDETSQRSARGPKNKKKQQASNENSARKLKKTKK